MAVLRILALLALSLCLAFPAMAAEKIVPRAGFAIAPLPTDAPVQKGMAAIRDIVATNHSLVTHRRMPPDHALRFAAQVKVEADKILASTSLSGDARDKLKALLEEIVTGLGAVAKPAEGTAAIDGLGRVDAALGRYPAEFDDPSWQPLQAVE
ncbi:MAG: hypothetical protein WDN31_22305 [Hyphomicrobium sp.]